MKKIFLIVILSAALLQSLFGQQQTINNGETGLAVRTKLNDMFSDLFENSINIQFSSNGSTNWHDTYTETDNYFRITRDLGVTWSDAIFLWNGSVFNSFETDTLIIGTDTITGVGSFIQDSVFVTLAADTLFLGSDTLVEVTDIEDLIFSAIHADTLFIGSDTLTSITDMPLTQKIYKISLPSASTLSGRCSAAAEGDDYPTGWTVEAGANPVDLKITHGLGRRAANVTIFSVTGTEERQLFDNAAFSGILTESTNILRIESLATIEKEISIYIMFE